MHTVKSVLEAKASEKLQKELDEARAKASKKTEEEQAEAIKANSRGRWDTGINWNSGFILY